MSGMVLVPQEARDAAVDSVLSDLIAAMHERGFTPLIEPDWFAGLIERAVDTAAPIIVEHNRI